MLASLEETEILGYTVFSHYDQSNDGEINFGKFAIACPNYPKYNVFHACQDSYSDITG